jgi:hypothetical protein
MREFTPRWFPTSRALAAALGLLVCSAAYADSSDGGQPAVWAQKEFKFTYLGFTTKYSCDGLDGKMRTILLELGARKQDLKISDWGCEVRTGRPDPFPGVAVKMSVLVPADSPGAPAGAQTLPSHWKALKLKLDSPSRSSLSEAGECELVEQVKEKVLPFFTTRNVGLRDNCVPHQLTPGGTLLTAEVLAPDQTQSSTAAGK